MNSSYIPLTKFIVRKPAFSYNAINNDEQRSEMFKEALCTSSKNLYNEYIRFINGSLNEKKSYKLKKTLLKYFNRMSFRCTPFGSFAAVGVGEYTYGGELSIGSEIKQNCRIKIETMHKIYVKFVLSCNKSTFEKISLIRNQTIVFIGNKIHFYGRDSDGKVIPASLNISGILKSILLFTTRKINIRYLIHKVIKIYDITEDRLTEYLKDLINNNLLITDIDIATYGEDNLARLNKFVNKYNINDSNGLFIKELYRLILSINHYDQCSLQRVEIKKRINALIESYLDVENMEMFHIDSFIACKSILPNAILKNITPIMELLIINPNNINSAMREFKRKFQQRYGEMEVPLTEAIDSEIGIGYNQSYTTDTQIIDKIRRVYHAKTNKSVYKTIISPFEKMVLKAVASKKIIKDSQFDITETIIENSKKNSKQHAQTFLLPLSLSCTRQTHLK